MINRSNNVKFDGENLPLEQIVQNLNTKGDNLTKQLDNLTQEVNGFSNSFSTSSLNVTNSSSSLSVSFDKVNGGQSVPIGNTLERPLSPPDGTLRYNTDISSLETYNSNNGWTLIGSGGSNLTYLIQDNTQIFPGVGSIPEKVLWSYRADTNGNLDGGIGIDSYNNLIFTYDDSSENFTLIAFVNQQLQFSSGTGSGNIKKIIEEKNNFGSTYITISPADGSIQYLNYLTSSNIINGTYRDIAMPSHQFDELCLKLTYDGTGENLIPSVIYQTNYICNDYSLDPTNTYTYNVKASNNINCVVNILNTPYSSTRPITDILLTNYNISGEASAANANISTSGTTNIFNMIWDQSSNLFTLYLIFKILNPNLTTPNI